MLQFFIIPFQYRFTQKRKLYQLNMDIIYVFAEFVNLTVIRF